MKNLLKSLNKNDIIDFVKQNTRDNKNKTDKNGE